MNPHPLLDVARVPLGVILELRDAYRTEMRCQIVHDSWHERGFTHSYLLRVSGRPVGYGSVGGPPREPKDTVKEFFVLPEMRGLALPLFRQLLAASGARVIEAQTNDPLLALMLFDCAVELASDTILFDDRVTTTLEAPPGVKLRPVTNADRARVFAHTTEPVGDWGLEYHGLLAATGGFLIHYNPPYGDIYMEVSHRHRRQGLGSFLVQELKRICYASGHTPAARCGQDNPASRATLQRAGLLPCARIVRGRVNA